MVREISCFKTWLKVGLYLCLALSYASVRAQTFWTLQTGAFQDYREATQAVYKLQISGLDSYSEFYMQEDKQWVRVRVGCFDSKPTAEQFAQISQLSGANPVPMTAGSHQGICIARQVGAMLPLDPANWGIYQQDQTAVEFWFQVQSVRAYLAYSGSSWNLNETPLLSSSTASVTSYFRETNGQIQLYYPNEPVLTLTSGKLLWQHDLTAVILENNILAAYQLSLDRD